MNGSIAGIPLFFITYDLSSRNCIITSSVSSFVSQYGLESRDIRVTGVLKFELYGSMIQKHMRKVKTKIGPLSIGSQSYIPFHSLFKVCFYYSYR